MRSCVWSADGAACPRCKSSNTVETGPAFGHEVHPILCAACGLEAVVCCARL